MRISAVLAAAVLLQASSCRGGADVRGAVPGPARAAVFPPGAIREGWRAFGFELEISGARVEHVLGLTPDWIVQIGPEAGTVQYVSANCIHGVSALPDASLLPRFVLRDVPGHENSEPSVSCHVILTRDFEAFDTVGIEMRLDRLRADP